MVREVVQSRIAEDQIEGTLRVGERPDVGTHHLQLGMVRLCGAHDFRSEIDTVYFSGDLTQFGKESLANSLIEEIGLEDLSPRFVGTEPGLKKRGVDGVARGSPNKASRMIQIRDQDLVPVTLVGHARQFVQPSRKPYAGRLWIGDVQPKWVLSPQMRERLLGLFEGEIDEMEELTKLDLDAWRY